MAKKKKIDHIVFKAGDTNIHCLNCGAVHVIQLPIEISALCKKIQAMKDLHEDCPKKDTNV